MSNYQSSGSHDKSVVTPPPATNCPRCDSPKTKFCYYNNYSLSQPRYFCKTCKRYWTKGGALRNVPIGGSCRKTKKISRSFSSDSKDSSSASSYSDLGRFGFSDGPDFQIGEGLIDVPRSNNTSNIPTIRGQLVSSTMNNPIVPISSGSIPNFGLNPDSQTNLSQFVAPNDFSLCYSSSSSILKQYHVENNVVSFNDGLAPEMVPVIGNLSSSMDSFGSISQDLYLNLPQERMGEPFSSTDLDWELQQEGMNMMLSGGSSNIYQQPSNMIETTNNLENLAPLLKPYPASFQDLEISSEPSNISRKEDNGVANVETTNVPIEWHFGDSSYAPAVNAIPSIDGNGNKIEGWSVFDQYPSLP
ncbi:hypothetical protein DCAR_0416764 [Daucus carota subsp. sativus]|uniref:Dof zinc finger protein n=1 Tax=Daucus carota subsp. sativus TaxID=79200 RepID=A0A165XS62_DAUCS|nr:PREDICTED: dof zinc finger protein DOF5.7-like [Daucus carota subsp. sativus]WOG97424.1 hypothetical protein DCAR_0416764 [Daucus carota subsp. sativus]